MDHKQLLNDNEERVFEWVKKYASKPALLGSKFYAWNLDRFLKLAPPEQQSDATHVQALSHTVMRLSMYFVDNVNVLPHSKLLVALFGAWRECARRIIKTRQQAFWATIKRTAKPSEN